MEYDFARENVSLVAMNTKPAFVGAALFALYERRIRVVYAVPEKYNSLYSKGVGTVFRYDVSELIARANTEAL